MEDDDKWEVEYRIGDEAHVAAQDWAEPSQSQHEATAAPVGAGGTGLALPALLRLSSIQARLTPQVGPLKLSATGSASSPAGARDAPASLAEGLLAVAQGLPAAPARRRRARSIEAPEAVAAVPVPVPPIEDDNQSLPVPAPRASLVRADLDGVAALLQAVLPPAPAPASAPAPVTLVPAPSDPTISNTHKESVSSEKKEPSSAHGMGMNGAPIHGPASPSSPQAALPSAPGGRSPHQLAGAAHPATVFCTAPSSSSAAVRSPPPHARPQQRVAAPLEVDDSFLPDTAPSAKGTQQRRSTSGGGGSGGSGVGVTPWRLAPPPASPVQPGSVARSAPSAPGSAGPLRATRLSQGGGSGLQGTTGTVSSGGGLTLLGANAVSSLLRPPSRPGPRLSGGAPPSSSNNNLVFSSFLGGLPGSQPSASKAPPPLLGFGGASQQRLSLSMLTQPSPLPTQLPSQPAPVTLLATQGSGGPSFAPFAPSSMPRSSQAATSGPRVPPAAAAVQVSLSQLLQSGPVSVAASSSSPSRPASAQRRLPHQLPQEEGGGGGESNDDGATEGQTTVEAGSEPQMDGLADPASAAPASPGRPGAAPSVKALKVQASPVSLTRAPAAKRAASLSGAAPAASPRGESLLEQLHRLRRAATSAAAVFRHAAAAGATAGADATGAASNNNNAAALSRLGSVAMLASKWSTYLTLEVAPLKDSSTGGGGAFRDHPGVLALRGTVIAACGGSHPKVPGGGSTSPVSASEEAGLQQPPPAKRPRLAGGHGAGVEEDAEAATLAPGDTLLLLLSPSAAASLPRAFLDACASAPPPSSWKVTLYAPYSLLPPPSCYPQATGLGGVKALLCGAAAVTAKQG